MNNWSGVGGGGGRASIVGECLLVKLSIFYVFVVLLSSFSSGMKNPFGIITGMAIVPLRRKVGRVNN